MAGDAIWLEVLPSLATFASDLVKGTTKAADDAGKASGAAFGKQLTDGATSGQNGLVTALEKTAKSAQKVVDAETQNIAKARAAQRDATARVIEAEAKLEAARATGDSAKVAAAEERLAGARERASGAAENVEVVERRLAAATTARNDAAEELAKTEADLAKSTEEVGAESEKAGGALQRMKDKLLGAGDGADGLKGKLATAGGFLRDNLQKMALATGGAALAVGKGLYEVGAVFDDLGDTIRTGTGLTGDALDDLIGNAENVGRRVPASFEQIGPVVADLNTRLGLTGETMETVASQYLEAGRILGEDVDIAATSAAFSAFKIEGDAVVGAMDTLFQVSQATGVGMNELAKQVQDNAPAMANLGFTFEETASLVGQLDKAGLESTKTMAAMSKGLVELAKDGEAPDEAFRRVTGEISTLIEKGDIAGALDLSSGIFGTRAASQFVGAVQSGTLELDNLVGQIGATEDTILGVGAETADFAESWQLVKNNALLALEPLGSLVFTALGDSLKEAMPLIEGFSAWAKENPAVLQSVAIGLGVLTAAIGAAAAVQWAMNAAWLASPITWVIVGVGALIAAIVALVLNWESVVAFLNDTFGPALDAVGQWFEDVGAWFGETWETIKGFFSGAGDWVSNTWSSGWETATDWIGAKVEDAAEAADQAWEDTKAAFQVASDWVSNTWSSGWETATDWIGAKVEDGKNAAGQAWEDAKKGFSVASDWVRNTWSSKWSEVKGVMKDPVGAGASKIDEIFGTDLRGSLDGARAWVQNTWSAKWSKVKGFMEDPVGNGLDGVRGLLGPLGLEGAFNTAVDAAGRIWDRIKEKISAPVRWVAEHVLNPLASGIERVAKLFGISWSLPRFSFATGGTAPRASGAQVALADGGMMPGYTPGRDVHTFYSPTGGLLELSGGEPVLRPEAGAVLGTSWVDGINAAARSGGQDGVRRFLHEQGLASGGHIALAGGGRIIANANQGFRGYDPTALTMIQAWARATGRAWSMTGNGGARTFGDQLRAWNLYRAGRGPLAANPWRGGPHMMPAIAMDLSPRPGQIASARALLSQFGLGLPVRGEPWHVQYLRGRRGGMTAGGGGFDLAGLVSSTIGSVAKVSGAGQWGDLLNAIPKTLIEKATAALQSRLFDGGGMLPPGLSVAVNRSGAPEPVLTGGQWADMKRIADRAGVPGDGASAEEIRRALEGMRLRVDLDNGDAWFEEKSDRRDRRAGRRRAAREGVAAGAQ